MTGRLTLQDRCLLHLLDRAGLAPEDEAAEELLQDRIAESFGAQRAHVSRAMKKLGKRGLVLRGRVQARGEGRRRVAYFPTEEGVRAAKAVRERVEQMPVLVTDLAGQEATRRLCEVPALLSRKVRFSDLVGAIHGGALDLRRLEGRQGRVHRGRAYDVRGAIVAPHFRGRREVHARLDAFLADPHARGFLLLGLPGIGKTAAVSVWAESLRGRYHVLWRRLQADGSAAELLRDLAGLLQMAGRFALSDRLYRPPEGPSDDVRLLQRDLTGVPAVLVFDDAHAAGGDVATLVAAMVAIDGEAAGPKIVILGREAPQFLSAEDVARRRVWREVLDDLSREDAESVLDAMGVPRPRRLEILAQFGGHPLSLELAATGGMPLDAVRRTSAALLAEAILDRLNAEDRDALSLAAVFGDPVPAGLLGTSADGLEERALLRDAGGGRFAVHDLVRDAVLRELAAEKAADLHVRVAGALARSSEPRDALAAMRHLAQAGAFREAEQLATERSADVIDGGLAAPLVPFLEQLSWTSRGSDLAPRISLLLGHALSALGRWREAARAYEGCDAAKDPLVAAEALLGRGKAELQRRSRLALALLDAARDSFERLGALRLLAEVQYWIGCVRENAARLDEAQEAFERGRAIAFDVGDQRWEGMCAYGVGRIRSRHEDYRGAVAEETAALQLLERDGRRLDIAKVCAGLGGNLFELGRLEEAEGYLDRANGEARATGANGSLAAGLYNLAGIRAKAGRFRDARLLLEESLPLFEDQEQFEIAVQCAAWNAAYAANEGLKEVSGEYFQRAEALVARAKGPALQARALRSLAEAERESGRVGDARRHLERAIVDARAAGLPELVAQLSKERQASISPPYNSRARTSRTTDRRRTPRRPGTRT